MSGIASKIVEGLKLHGIVAERYGSATVYWNGGAITTTAGTGWDTRDYKHGVVAIQVGTVLGEAVTLSNAVYESDVDNPALAVAITGGGFTDIYTANDEVSEYGAIDLQQRRRYLWLRTQVQGSLPTIDFAGGAIFGCADSEPVSQTLKFDI